MENQELNLWLLKKIQTENSLRSEERRLENAKTEYNSEKNKYLNAKETFQSTKLRLLNDKNNDSNPKVKLEQGKAESSKLQNEKNQLDSLSDRLASVESKVKRHCVLVLQNKRKLEILEEKINFLHGKKMAKKNFKEELEVLDSKIQQMVFNNLKNKSIKDVDSVDKVDRSEKDYNNSALEEFDSSIYIEKQNTFNNSDSPQLSFDNQSGNFSQSQNNQSFHQNNNHGSSGAENSHAERSNQEYYEQIQNLNYLKDDQSDSVNLRYYNKSGSCFEVEVRRQHDHGLIVDIKSYSKLDAFALNGGKQEILKSLKEQGLKINSITVRSVDYGAE